LRDTVPVYRLLFALVVRVVPAELAHRVGFGLIRFLDHVPGLRTVVRRWLTSNDPILRVSALGLEFAGPLGLAAGFDKDGLGVTALGRLGFGHVEVGTVTAQAQPGNPRPRLFRLPRDRALLNRMGFNNAGAIDVAARLRESDRTVPIGVNIGKTKAVPDSEAVTDYVSSAIALARVADYLVVNVSSPNTPGLRDLQSVDRLRPILGSVREALDKVATRRVPLLVKIAPDLADPDVDAVADLALELELDGIIATNTTISRAGLHTPADEVAALGAGGVSGAPVADRALAVLCRLRARVGDGVLLIAAGGVESAEDAWERIRAGATLVQGYTGFIYGGPLWPRRLHRELARLARAAGHARITDAVGSAVVGD
jgi:dihydroorotate dehydrogenase